MWLKKCLKPPVLKAPLGLCRQPSGHVATAEGKGTLTTSCTCLARHTTSMTTTATLMKPSADFTTSRVREARSRHTFSSSCSTVLVPIRPVVARGPLSGTPGTPRRPQAPAGPEEWELTPEGLQCARQRTRPFP